jgi:hypothetical protein
MKPDQNECLYCHQTSLAVPLILLEYQDQKMWICPQHLPILIHKPEQLIGRLPGAENLAASDHDHG